jgi:hypothetical protein
VDETVAAMSYSRVDPGDVLLMHAWKSGDVSDGDVASDVTSHTMVITITTIKRMVITAYHHDPVAWHGTVQTST